MYTRPYPVSHWVHGKYWKESAWRKSEMSAWEQQHRQVHQWKNKNTGTPMGMPRSLHTPTSVRKKKHEWQHRTTTQRRDFKINHSDTWTSLRCPIGSRPRTRRACRPCVDVLVPNSEAGKDCTRDALDGVLNPEEGGADGNDEACTAGSRPSVPSGAAKLMSMRRASKARQRHQRSRRVERAR
ncbi:hypothetical protein BCR44DRAFT_286494 [Catenaria anguillulae PL171]|uniref:Uncharacterized protein n=1 Tax=Catenaria anguillulae PL171 TaxID=765915 RepID=A0A1Y2HRS7_9FUNG|nr:hypothetical protein BCR44DRAFT_286494 [Catenaria anguillulae PL171]